MGRRPAGLARPATRAVTAAAVLIGSPAGAGRWGGAQASAGHWFQTQHVSAGQRWAQPQVRVPTGR